MTAKIIDGREIAKNIRTTVANEVKALVSKYDITPTITTIKIGSNPESELYLKLRDKACNEVGIISDHINLPIDVSEQEVLQTIKQLNKDNNTHGVLIQYPIPDHISKDLLMGAVDPKKDVEGFNPQNMGNLLIGNELIIPCTPLAVLTILEHEKVDFKGKEVVIVNHSNVVGKPLAAIFLNRNASVSICHVFSKDIKLYTSKADILVTATGQPRLITADHVKKDAFVIDVGITSTKDGVCGDVDMNSVKEKAGKITPVPGGVGPVTVACSLKNILKTYKNCIE